MCDSYGKATIITLEADLDSEATCAYRRSYFRKVIEEVISQHGRLDILVLNAGVNAHFHFGDLKEV